MKVVATIEVDGDRASITVTRLAGRSVRRLVVHTQDDAVWRSIDDQTAEPAGGLEWATFLVELGHVLTDW